MARKSNYDKLVDSITKRLREMRPGNSKTIEEAIENQHTLAGFTGSEPATEADFSYCDVCGCIMWHGVCYECE